MTRLKLLAVLGGIVLAGCQAGPPSASPGESPSTSLEASAGASASTSALESTVASPDASATIDRSITGGILPPDSIAIVMVEGLRVRETASLTGKVLASFPKGTRFLISGNPSSLGPVVADGYAWYLVVHRDVETDPSTEILGYAAAGAAAKPLMATARPRCGDAAQITLTAYEQLACYGNGPLTLEGTYGCGGCGGLAPGTFEPGWLANPLFPPLPVLTAKPGKGIGRIDIHFVTDGELEYPVEGSILRVVGHYDDSVASSCHIAPGVQGEQVEADSRAAILYCRERFVVDSYEQIGTDPGYGTS
jgi:hypothetical protein